MQSNLMDVYAYLQRFSLYSVSYQEPVSYLKSILGANANEKVILVSSQEKCSISNFTSPSKLKLEKKVDPGYYEGSPLKDDCNVEAIELLNEMKLTSTSSPWTYDEECLKGIPVEKAQSILNDPELQSIRSSGSLWILCDGSDANKTMFLEFHFSDRNFIRGMITFQGICASNAIDSKDLFQTHYEIMPHPAKVDTTIECFYNIKSNICLKSSWSTESKNPPLINFKNNDMILYQTFTLSESNHVLEDFLTQIKCLMDIKEDIINYKENLNNIKEPIYRCEVGMQLHNIKEKIINSMTEISGFNDMESYSTDGYDIEAVVQRAKQRTPTDLTDKLWDIIRFCSSYSDLKLAFNYIFQCAAKCNIVNTPTNENRLAEIIREISNRRLAIPCLTGTEPLELILEIGIEKLFKDYEFIFAECKICSSIDLRKSLSERAQNESKQITAPINLRKSLYNAARSDHMSSMTKSRQTLLHANKNDADDRQNVETFGFQNSRFDRADVDFHLAKILQIHLTLEHLILIHINLNFSHAYGYISEQLLKKPLPMVKTIDESLVDKIEIPIAVDYVRERLENSDPNIRRITLKSKNKFREVQSTYYFNMQNICPPNVCEFFETDEKETVKSYFYYCWRYRKITTTN